MANGKIQMVCNLPMFQILNHLPFDLCHLPFELYLVLAFKFRGLACSTARGIDPSPVTLRLMKAPERDTLSPRERVVSPRWGEGWKYRSRGPAHSRLL
jgi:hypothetical protein